MPLVTQIDPQKRRENRRNIYLDGKFAFGVNINVVAAFFLREGLFLSPEQVGEIERGELRQEVFDKAMDFITRRMHSRTELSKKLARREYGQGVIDTVLEDLERLGYIDDARFAVAKATSAAKHKHHGKRRATIELARSGVRGETARRAVEDVYKSHDSMGVARELAQKQAVRLKKLDPMVARRRLFGMLLRRGFEYEEIRPVVEEVLGGKGDGDA